MFTQQVPYAVVNYPNFVSYSCMCCILCCNVRNGECLVVKKGGALLHFQLGNVVVSLSLLFANKEREIRYR